MLGKTIRSVAEERRKVTVELTFSAGDMLRLFARTPRASFDRILVSNVPDYTGWAPVFTLASPLLKRSPQSVISGDCLRNPPIFSSFEMLFEASTLVPWKWTAARLGLDVIWGSTSSYDTVAIGVTPDVVGFQRGVMPRASEYFGELARLLARSLYVKDPQKVHVNAAHATLTGEALEVVSSSSSALAVWALVAHDEIPLHIIRGLACGHDGEWYSSARLC